MVVVYVAPNVLYALLWIVLAFTLAYHVQQYAEDLFGKYSTA